MTDERLSELFAEGTAPERDAAFARSVNARIGPVRPGPGRLRLPFALTVRAALMLAAAGAMFAAGRALEPALTRIAETSPHFMGVPVPVVLGVLVFGLTLGARRYLPLPGAIAGAAGR